MDPRVCLCGSLFGALKSSKIMNWVLWPDRSRILSCNQGKWWAVLCSGASEAGLLDVLCSFPCAPPQRSWKLFSDSWGYALVSLTGQNGETSFKLSKTACGLDSSQPTPQVPWLMGTLTLLQEQSALLTDYATQDYATWGPQTVSHINTLWGLLCWVTPTMPWAEPIIHRPTYGLGQYQVWSSSKPRKPRKESDVSPVMLSGQEGLGAILSSQLGQDSAPLPGKGQVRIGKVLYLRTWIRQTFTLLCSLVRLYHCLGSTDE